jgi:hypothetical protein
MKAIKGFWVIQYEEMKVLMNGFNFTVKSFKRKEINETKTDNHQIIQAQPRSSAPTWSLL